MNQEIRVIQCGLGPIGLRTTRELVGRRGLRIVAALDVDPALAGRDLGELAGLDRTLGVPVRSDVDRVVGEIAADLAIVTTASSLARAATHFQPFLARRLPVLTSCEEAAFPFETAPALAETIDGWARASGVPVLATGINPGFLMDLLPIVLSAPCASVERVRVERIQDAAKRRLPFQKKVGAGLDPATFAAQVAAGELKHVGLTESMQMIAGAFGFDLERYEDRIEPVIAEGACASAEIRVEKGFVRGVRQTGRAWRSGEVEPVIEMHFLAAIGVPDARDRVLLEGQPRIDSLIQGGVPGDLGTAAILVNAIPSVLSARPGLQTMATVAPPHFWR